MRLDHLLSKEQHCLGPRRMFSGVPSVFLRRSLVTRLVGSISTSAHQPVTLRTCPEQRPGRRRHHRDPNESGVHCSVLRKRSISATSVRQNGRHRLVVEPARQCGVPTTSAYRSLGTLHGFGATLENCIASTSVLKVWLLALFLPRKSRGVCDFKLQRANGGCLGARCR